MAWILAYSHARVSSESQPFYTIGSIAEIKQILQMNGSKIWPERD